ncbi:hypothetical protein WAK64_15970 [Bacillus spongiae]|uniref:Cytosolic protein n=1 Tax=Bacillus spongiae TaxID=2683610 RepID=A0ABU8HGN0_9BACI
MYVGRDMTELSMLPKNEWRKSELAFFHHAFQQIVPYLNTEGQTIHRQIVEEMESRSDFHRKEADWTHGTRVHYE